MADDAPAAEGTIDVSGDGGCVKKILVAPSDPDDKPPSGVSVRVHYVGTLQSDGSKFDSSRDRGDPFSFKLGAGQVIKGWDQGVASMARGEKSILTCRSDYAYGEQGSPPKIPGGATLDFEVELLDWDEPEPDTTEQRLEAASKRKEEGNELFKASDFVGAAGKYEKAVQYFEYSFGLKDEEKSEVDAIKLPCLLNMAMCQLKTKDFSDAAVSCSKALDIDTHNVKALFRRGKARAEMGDYDIAKADLKEAIKYAPNNKDLRSEFARIKQAEAKALSEEKARAQRMFS
jgi:peptidylprolyl isomerase